MATTTNFGWTTPDDTDLVKDGAAAIRTLGSGIDTSLVDLKGGTTGQVLSKTSNTDMDFTWVAQDDTNAIQNAIIDAKGDLIVGTAADTPARLAVGTNNYVLTADSAEASGVKWAAPTAASYVGCSMYYTGDITASNNTYTQITWNTEIFDTDSLHSTVTNTSRITIPTGKGGKWLFSCDLRFGQDTTGYRFFRFYKNGSATDDYSGLTDAEGHLAIHLTRVIDLAAGDYVEIYGLQNSGGNLAIQGGVDANRWQATYLGA